MLSFLPAFPIFPFDVKSCHLDLPASSSRFALIFLGIFAGFGGPSATILGSFFAAVAKAGFISATAVMTFVGAGVGVDEDAGEPSAFRFFVSVLWALWELFIGLISGPLNASVLPYDLKVT